MFFRSLTMPYKQFLGYRKGENGEPEIVPEEAETVRRIYRLFLDGMTPYKIKLTFVRFLQQALDRVPAFGAHV